MRINHNIAALNTYRQLSNNGVNTQKALEKLSSGLRINKAGDDAAGLAISEKMRGQIRGLDQAARNAQDSISMIQTAEGALNETHSILQRMRELAVQAGNDTNTTTDRAEIQKEINQLTSEINRIGNTTEFNTQKLLNATSGTVTAASAATVTGSAITLGGGTDFSTTNLVFDVVIGSTTKSVTLNKNYDGSTNTIDTLVSDLNTALSGAATVSKDTNGTALVITAANTTDSIEIKAATSGNLSAIGLTAGVYSPNPAKSSFTMQIGANQSQTMTLEFNDMRAAALGLTGTGAGYTSSAGVTDGTNNNGVEYGLDVSNATNAGIAVTKIQAAIDKVSAERSKLGAYQNRLEHTINNLGTSSENLTSAESRIRDVDYAKAA
ncbi:flagellin [Desulfotomaculum nigrificans]|uniref:flagellin N-terminal helical domain-containing protein n=1 Tax=Desulfotomaculum nigrificans TaxID=1565 RepID=UPI0001FAE733|nr:flagellin [Desulfotomaculum nigrificans]